MDIPRVRAILIAVVLAWQCLDASPIPTKVNGKRFDNDIAREELDRWSQTLSGLGVERSPEQLKAEVLQVGGALAGVKKALLKPFQPISRITQTGQAWGLFTYPVTTPHRLEIYIQEPGSPDWRLVYRALDDEHDWHQQHFVFRRLRGVYDDNANKTRSSYDNFARWVAREAFTDFPQASAVKMHMVRTHTTLPDEPDNPRETARLVRTVQRDSPDKVSKGINKNFPQGMPR